MKNTNLRVITALALGSLLAVTALNAQEKPARPGRPESAPPGEGRPGPRGPGDRAEAAKERLAKMAEELNLTDEQKTKIQAVMKDSAEQRKELRDATPEERRAKGKEILQEINAQMKAILTAEQFTKWEKLRPAPGQRPGGPGGPGGERHRPAGDKPADKE